MKKLSEVGPVAQAAQACTDEACADEACADEAYIYRKIDRNRLKNDILRLPFQFK